MSGIAAIRRRCVASLLWLLAGLVAPGVASALPSCPPASPAQISDPRFLVNTAWQRYRNLSPTHRCCAKPCEPIQRLAAKIEASGIQLDAVARNPRLAAEVTRRARADANEMFGLRLDLSSDFIGCLNDTAPRAGSGGQVCGQPDMATVDLAWLKWCDAFLGQSRRFRDLLVAKVGNSVGGWSVQTNYFRILPNGTVDDDTGSLSILGAPNTRLPPGATARQFQDLVQGMRFPPFPGGAGLTRMYMQLTTSVLRPTGGDQTLVTSPILRGPCPGFSTRP